MNREKHIQDEVFYHVYNRGNDKDRIFGDDSDFYAFIDKMKSLAAEQSIDVPVYTLMPNHYHLIALQNPGGNLSKMMGALATSAAKRYNLKYRHIGHLFQGPFRYKFVQEELMWYVACYIHLNPVRAGLVRQPEEWRFSNFGRFAGLGKRSPSSLDQAEKKETFSSGLWQGYPDYVREVLNEERIQKEWEKKMCLHMKGILDEG